MYIRLFIISLVIVFTGCSSKFAYNNIDWLVYWYVDDYIEFSDNQEKLFDRKLSDWLDWHRSEELKRYTAHLDRIKRKISASSLDAAEIAQEFDLAQQHWQRLRDRIGPELAELAPQLTDEQIIYLFAELESRNKERLEDREELSTEELHEQRTEDIIDDLERYVGRLNDEQKTLIAEFAPKFESTFDLWIEYRRKVQGEARRLFALRNDTHSFINSLATLLSQPDRYRTQEHIEKSKQNRQFYIELIVKLHETLTTKQRDKLIGELDDLIDDIEALQALGST